MLMLAPSLTQIFSCFFVDHLSPVMSSDWNISVIGFTLILAAFAAVLEAGGGFRRIIHTLLQSDGSVGKRVEWGAFGLGMICFFDGLANSMLVGRTLGNTAQAAGVSRARLAYIVDSTSSAVACVALISTWIAYQLSMMQEGFLLAGTEPQVSLYQLFVYSIPYNFYCWFTLILLAISIQRNWHVGPMRQYREKVTTERDVSVELQEAWAPVKAVMVPLMVLMLALFLGLYVSGSSAIGLPHSVADVANAFGNSDAARVLLRASAFGLFIAVWMNRRYVLAQQMNLRMVILKGVQNFLQPLLILLSAWLLSSVLKALGVHTVLGELLGTRLDERLFPALVFITGSLISFATGTSWGTMGLLMPLVIPVLFSFDNVSIEQTAASVAAVFSGAVFGDHCSPFSDTTIVASISCGVEPYTHVKTQLPYALLAAFVALLIGFVPVGLLGLHPLFQLLIGTLLIYTGVRMHQKAFP
jgi:Na+/H+ antiporter NhaC